MKNPAKSQTTMDSLPETFIVKRKGASVKPSQPKRCRTDRKSVARDSISTTSDADFKWFQSPRLVIAIDPGTAHMALSVLVEFLRHRWALYYAGMFNFEGGTTLLAARFASILTNILNPLKLFYFSLYEKCTRVRAVDHFRIDIPHVILCVESQLYHGTFNQQSTGKLQAVLGMYHAAVETTVLRVFRSVVDLKVTSIGGIGKKCLGDIDARTNHLWTKDAKKAASKALRIDLVGKALGTQMISIEFGSLAEHICDSICIGSAACDFRQDINSQRVGYLVPAIGLDALLSTIHTCPQWSRSEWITCTQSDRSPWLHRGTLKRTIVDLYKDKPPVNAQTDTAVRVVTELRFLESRLATDNYDRIQDVLHESMQPTGRSVIAVTPEDLPLKSMDKDSVYVVEENVKDRSPLSDSLSDTAEKISNNFVNWRGWTFDSWEDLYDD